MFLSLKFFICSDFLAESLGQSSDSKIIEIKTYLFENFSQKKSSRKFYVIFLGYKIVKNGQLYHF